MNRGMDSVGMYLIEVWILWVRCRFLGVWSFAFVNKIFLSFCGVYNMRSKLGLKYSLTSTALFLKMQVGKDGEGKWHYMPRTYHVCTFVGEISQLLVTDNHRHECPSPLVTPHSPTWGRMKKSGLLLFVISEIENLFRVGALRFYLFSHLKCTQDPWCKAMEHGGNLSDYHGVFFLQ